MTKPNPEWMVGIPPDEAMRQAGLAADIYLRSALEICENYGIQPTPELLAGLVNAQASDMQTTTMLVVGNKRSEALDFVASMGGG